MFDILVCICILSKNLLMDEQFNVPEDNNNIADILNELEYSLSIYHNL